MTKVYPNASALATQLITSEEPAASKPLDGGDEVVLTVWKKSLLMSCDGFTVFDSKGNLIFRVDNYMTGRKGEFVLMDASGKSLLTIRRKRLSLGDNWLVYDGDTAANPLYTVAKHVSLLNSKSTLAHVTSTSSYTNGDNNKKKMNITDRSLSLPSSLSSPSKRKQLIYEIEGSYAQRCCTIYDDKQRAVAEIKRKEAVKGMVLGTDVFRLVIVQPHEIESSVAMSLVIILDQMFGSSRRNYPMFAT